MKKFALVIGFAIPIFSGIANADVIQIQYTDATGTPISKKGSPYYMNPQSGFKAGFSAGIGRKIVAEVKDANGVIVDTKTKTKVTSTDKFIVNGVTYFGSEFDFNNLNDGKYTLTSIVYATDQTEVSRQLNEIYLDTKAPQIKGDFYWAPFGVYVFKHTDDKLIVSNAGGTDAGFPSIDAGVSGFSHGTFSSQFLDGPNAGTFHAVDTQLLLTNQGKLIIGNGTINSIPHSQIPNNTANQMRLIYKIFNKAGGSSSRSVDVYVATRKSPKPDPYGVFTGAPVKLDGVAVFNGFEAYVPDMTVPSNPVRMIYRAPKEFYIGGGGDAEIYGSWLNGSRGPNKVVHTDAQYIYFDLTGSSDGKQYSTVQHYTRDVSNWRNHLFTHSIKIPTGMEAPKSTGYSIFIKGKNEWRNAYVSQYITKDDTNGIKDEISKIKVQVEPRAYDQRFSYDYAYVNSAFKGSCTIPPGETECIMDTALPFPGDDAHEYHNRTVVRNLSGTLLGDELVSYWRYDGSIAELNSGSVNNDTLNKTLKFGFVNKHNNRVNGESTIRVLNAVAVNSEGVKFTLPRTSLVSSAMSATDQLFTGTYRYSGLVDGAYSIEAYVEDGFSGTFLRNKSTHSLLSDVVIDITAPKITTNIQSQTVKSLPSVVVNTTDFSIVKIKSVVLTGGIDNVNISLPMVSLGSNSFRPEHVFIAPSQTHLYTMTIIAEDEFGNQSSKIESFYYVPNIVKLPNIKQPAISSPLKSENGLPSNIIRTPQIENTLGELAQGNHDVTFTLLPTAGSAMIINGVKLTPGESKDFTVNLSQTNHQLVFEAYPAVSGVEISNQYEIHLADIKVSVCPDTFTLNSGQCVHLSFSDPLLKCNQPYALADGQCQIEVVYDPSTTCLTGYDLDGTFCRGTYQVSPFSVCPPGYSLVGGNSCKEVQTIALKVCPDGQTVENGFCKASNGTTSPQKSYCQGKDISGGSFCDNGTCYDYKKEWNACQISTTSPATDVCQVGSLSNGSCQVTDQYQLNMQCPFGYNRDGILCKRIEIIAPIKSCDSGYTLSGNICSKTETSPYIGCPATHVLLNGRCHEKEPIKITCPASYDWNDTECIKDEQSSAVPVCPTDFTFNGTLCQKDDIVNAVGQCPVGKTWDGSSCNETLTNPATPVCSAGLTWNGTECYAKETQSGSLACGSGYTWNGTTCARLDSINATYGCPSTYTWNSVKSICERAATQPATAQCASGYALNGGGQCEKTDTAAPVKQCTPGFTYDGTICNKTESQAATKQCPVGYTLKADGSQCERIQTTSSTSQCPDGYTWNGSTCRSAYTTGVNPTGFTCPFNNYAASSPTAAFQNVCQSTQPVNCPSGYGNNPDDETRCYASNYTPSYGGPCPVSAPYKFVDNNYQCTTSPGQSWTVSGSCPAGYSYSSTQGCINNTKTPSIGWHCCEPGLTYNASTGKMDGYLDSSKVNSCPSGYTYQGSGVCSKTDIAAFSLSCAATWTLSGSTCTKTSTELPTDTCSSGWTLNGSSCTKLLTQSPSSYSCAAGWTLNGTNCNGIETTVRVYSCSADRTLVGSKCEKTVTQGRIWICPAGWTGGSLCTRITRDPPSGYQCPVDWTVNGSQCNQVIKQAPNSYVCDPGWVNESDKCRMTTTAAVSSYQCDADWTLDGTICRIRRYETETRSCNATYTQLDPATCYYNVPATSVGECAQGYASNMTQCSKSVTLPVNLSCNPQYDLVADQCHRTYVQDVSVECQPDEEVRDGKCVLIKKHSPKPVCELPYVLDAVKCKNEISIPSFN